jgi:YbbR domain-containing protein
MRGLGWVFDNLLYKCVALFVAVILWAGTQGFRSVEESLNLPVSLENYDRESFVVVEQSAQEINLRIVGSQAAVRRAERQLKRYPVSLTQLQPGELRLSVDPVQLALPRGARVSAWSPPNLVFRVEPVDRKQVQVRPVTVGQPPEGFRVVAVEVEPPQLVLAGARSGISRLREVSTEPVDVSGVRETTRYSVPIVIGRPNVWRDDQLSAVVAVVVRVEAIPDPPPGQDPEAHEAPPAG